MSTQPQRFGFSARQIEKLPLPKKPITYFDADVKHLGLRVQPSGRKTFYVLKRVASRTERKTLGVYPELTIDAARKHARRVLNDVADWKASGYEGVNPMARPDDNELTLAGAFELYVDGQLRIGAKNPDLAEKRRRWFFEHYLGTVKNRRLDTITPPQMAALHARIGEDNGQLAANRALKLARAVFNYAIRKSLATADPTRGVTMYPEHKRARFLQPDELLKLDKALQDEPNGDLRDFVTLLLATGARKSNVYAAKWADISFEFATWTISETESKNAEALSIQLTPRAVDVLKQRAARRSANNPWVFPSASSASGHVEDYKNQWYRLLKRAGFPPRMHEVTMHDLRRTCASYQAIAGSSLQMVGASLGHRDLASTQIYSRLLQSSVRESLLNGERKQATLKKAALKRAKKATPLLAS